MQVMDISLLTSDGTWVIYLSHNDLGVSMIKILNNAEAQLIPGVRRLVLLLCSSHVFVALALLTLPFRLDH